MNFVAEALKIWPVWQIMHLVQSDITTFAHNFFLKYGTRLSMFIHLITSKTFGVCKDFLLLISEVTSKMFVRPTW